MQKHETYQQYKIRYAREHQPAPGKLCMILRVSDKRPMLYTADKKLIPSTGAFATVFESSRKARTAKWHAVQNSGIPNSHVLWEIVPF